MWGAETDGPLIKKMAEQKRYGGARNDASIISCSFRCSLLRPCCTRDACWNRFPKAFYWQAWVPEGAASGVQSARLGINLRATN